MKLNNLPKTIGIEEHLASASLVRLTQRLFAFLVAAILAIWLLGPRTGAGIFDLAHYLVPAEARALILGADSAEILTADESSNQLKFWGSNPQSIPSIAGPASQIPGHLVDLSAIDRSILRSENERRAVAEHLAKKFRISLEDTLFYVNQAMMVSKEVNLDPTLILAVMAAFIPEANIRVGALILKACIARAGSLEDGLKSYLGAPSAASGVGTYTHKVFSEREELRNVARRLGGSV